MTRPARIVIVGASVGGLTTAETLRHDGFDGEIVLLGDEPHLPYLRPPLSKQVLLGDWEPDAARMRTREELDALGIEVRTGRPATGLDASARVVHTADGPVPFDEIVIATGSSPRPHPGLPGARTLRTVDDALALRAALRAAGRVAIVGAGILGSEIATAARKFGAETTIVGRSGSLGFGGVGPLLSGRLERLHAEHGVQLALRAPVAESSALSRGRTRLTLHDGRTGEFDVVVAMIGGAPRTEWLTASGLDLSDGVVCDASGVAAPGISAVGDVAAWRNPLTGRPVRVEHQSNAIEQAIAVAGRIVRGSDVAQPVPLFWSEIHSARVKAYGWFDPRRPLVDVPTDAGTGSLLFAEDAAGTPRGVVAWNAPPREFQAARARVAAHALDPADDSRRDDHEQSRTVPV